MNIQRIARHLLTTDGQVSRSFGPVILTKIEAAIQASETEHGRLDLHRVRRLWGTVASAAGVACVSGTECECH
jgi:hypothetical protein